MTPARHTPVVRLSGFPSGLGIVLAVCHSVVLVLFAANRPDIGPPPSYATIAPGGFFIDPYNSSASVIAGRSFHFAGEPLLLKVIYLLDIPTHLVSAALSLLAGGTGLGGYAVSWVHGISWLLVGALQWLYVGSFVTAYPAARRRRTPSSRTDA